jgi:hypothetical protein
MRGAIPPHPQYAFMAWCSLKKHRDDFIFNYDVWIKYCHMYAAGLKR